MNKIRLFATCFFAFSIQLLSAQDTLDLLQNLAPAPQSQKVISAFKSPRVIMTHSIEMVKRGVLDFRILHRFGTVNQGVREFFGLDQATIHLGLDYGLTNNLTIGIGRANYKKEVDGFLKYRVLQQSAGQHAVPLSLVLAGGSTVQTGFWTGPEAAESLANRLSYYAQLIAGRKFSEAFSLQLAPIIVHRNFVTAGDPNNTFALGIGGRIKLTHRVALNADYVAVINKDKSISTYNPLSIGFDIETGGHVFQLHFTNAIGMNERAFITETTNRWSKGDIQFGFNISRSFQIRKQKID